MDEKLRGTIYRLIQIHSPDTYECIEPTIRKIEQAFRDNGWVEQPDERMARMLQSGYRVRLWHDQRFLDRDTISHEWVVMDSQGNGGLGNCLYSGANLDKALDVLEREGK
jgi:hypothetical protein